MQNNVIAPVHRAHSPGGGQHNKAAAEVVHCTPGSPPDVDGLSRRPFFKALAGRAAAAGAACSSAGGPRCRLPAALPPFMAASCCWPGGCATSSHGTAAARLEGLVQRTLE